MGSTEHWDFSIICKQCGAEGTAETTELDGWSFMRAKQAGDKVRWVHPTAGFELLKPLDPKPSSILGDRRDDYVTELVCSACEVPASIGKEFPNKFRYRPEEKK